jgi:predicted aspartyl protease
MPTMVVDDYGKRKITFLHFSRTLKVASITLKNIFYNTIKQSKISASMRQSGIGGVLGMNVINRAHWIIDFLEGYIEAIPRKDTVLSGLEPKFSLSYGSSRVPKTAIVVQGIEIKNALIDSGSSSDLALRESDMRELNQKVQPIDSAIYYSSELLTDSIPKKKYLYKDIVINNYRFDTLSIRPDNTTLIGIGLFRKFDKVYLNTDKKMFLFY